MCLQAVNDRVRAMGISGWANRERQKATQPSGSPCLRTPGSRRISSVRFDDEAASGFAPLRAIPGRAGERSGRERNRWEPWPRPPCRDSPRRCRRLAYSRPMGKDELRPERRSDANCPIQGPAPNHSRVKHPRLPHSTKPQSCHILWDQISRRLNAEQRSRRSRARSGATLCPSPIRTWLYERVEPGAGVGA
jgi:hypothetical protein